MSNSSVYNVIITILIVAVLVVVSINIFVKDKDVLVQPINEQTEMDQMY